MTKTRRPNPPSPFDWLAGNNEPDRFGYRRCDPERVRAIYAIMAQADEERAKRAKRASAAPYLGE